MCIELFYGMEKASDLVFPGPVSWESAWKRWVEMRGAGGAEQGGGGWTVIIVCLLFI